MAEELYHHIRLSQLENREAAKLKFACFCEISFNKAGNFHQKTKTMTKSCLRLGKTLRKPSMFVLCTVHTIQYMFGDFLQPKRKYAWNYEE